MKGTEPGDKVKVWFSGERRDRRDVDKEWPPFTYTVKQNTGREGAGDRRRGLPRGQPRPNPPGTNAPQYAQSYLDAIRAAGYGADLWDTDKDGVPHDLGVLSRYKAVVWYLGDNRFTQDPEDFIDATAFGQLPDIGVAEREQYLTMAVRDFINAGGKLINTGELAQDAGLPGTPGGRRPVLRGRRRAERGRASVSTVAGPVRRLLDAGGRLPPVLARRVDADRGCRDAGPRPRHRGADHGCSSAVGGTPTNPLDEAGVIQPTTDVLPAAGPPVERARGREVRLQRQAVHADRGREASRGALQQDGDIHAAAAGRSTCQGWTAAPGPKLEFKMSLNIKPPTTT